MRTASSKTAGELLRQARRRAELTQQQLGQRAGVAQSVVSAYESGRRQPSVPTLERLVAATGSRLDLVLDMAAVSAPDRSSAAETSLRARIRVHRDEILARSRAAGVSNVRLFGSVARGEDTDTSDVDLLVDIGPDVGMLTLFRLQAALEAMLEAPVDLVPADGLSRMAAPRVLTEAVPL